MKTLRKFIEETPFVDGSNNPIGQLTTEDISSMARRGV